MVVGVVLVVAAIAVALAIRYGARSADERRLGPPPLARPIAADVAEFERIVADARAALQAEGRGQADPIWAQAADDVRAVQAQLVHTLREWPALGLSRGLAEKGFDDLDGRRRRVYEIIEPVESFHRDWRRRHEALVSRP